MLKLPEKKYPEGVGHQLPLGRAVGTNDYQQSTRGMLKSPHFISESVSTLSTPKVIVYRPLKTVFKPTVLTQVLNLLHKGR